MGLNISKGNMYEFVTHTWNVIKGKCFHDCDYCYMKRWGDLKPIRLDKKELKTDLGKKGLTEPSERKIKALISLLQKDSSVIIKKNLKRIN